MTQEKKQELKDKDQDKAKRDEIPDAELDKVSGGAEPVSASRFPKPLDPVNGGK